MATRNPRMAAKSVRYCASIDKVSFSHGNYGNSGTPGLSQAEWVIGRVKGGGQSVDCKTSRHT